MGHPKCTTLGHFGHIVQVHFEFYWLGTLQMKLHMSHLGTLQLLSLGKFKMYPSLSYLGHPSHMIWNTVNVLAVFCQ